MHSSSPEPTILLVCAKDRDLWQGPKQEVRESRTSGFCAQPQKFETITVTIGYKNGQLLRLCVTWPLPEVSILGADQKDRGLWGRECDYVLLFAWYFEINLTRFEKIAQRTISSYRFTTAGCCIQPFHNVHYIYGCHT